jgi:hypothetical protein
MTDDEELNDRIRALCESKGLKFAPWEIEPWDCDDGPSPWPHTTGAGHWAQAQQLRRQLIAELEANGRE